MLRTKPSKMKSLAFDLYLYSDSYGGRIICRQTKKDMQFNYYYCEKQRILDFIDSEYFKKFGKEAKAKKEVQLEFDFMKEVGKRKRDTK
jgi:hypothetical protein